MHEVDPFQAHVASRTDCSMPFGTMKLKQNNARSAQTQETGCIVILELFLQRWFCACISMLGACASAVFCILYVRFLEAMFQNPIVRNDVATNPEHQTKGEARNSKLETVAVLKSVPECPKYPGIVAMVLVRYRPFGYLDAWGVAMNWKLDPGAPC